MPPALLLSPWGQGCSFSPPLRLHLLALGARLLFCLQRWDMVTPPALGLGFRRALPWRPVNFTTEFLLWACPHPVGLARTPGVLEVSCSWPCGWEAPRWDWVSEARARSYHF